MFEDVFPDLGSYRILDLGGTADSWLRASSRPLSVTVLNLYSSELTVGRTDGQVPAWIDLVSGDACNPPSAIMNDSFDLVFSNSLIEHVGGASRRSLLADVVRRTAPRYWIQTPYRYFPIEPHYLFPGYQFLPLTARAHLARSWPLVHTRPTSWDAAVATALDVELVSVTEMKYLFPEATVLRERLSGIPKSLVAVRAQPTNDSYEP